MPSRLRSGSLLLTLSSLSGLLLFLSDYPVHAWPLQGVALIPWIVGLVKFCPSGTAAALAGFCLGLFYTAPLQWCLRFPWLMGGALALYLNLLWALISWGIHRSLRWPFPWSIMGAGAAAVIVEWLDFSMVPVWGTAQCFARVWSAAPWALSFITLTGITGLVFVLVTGQLLIVLLATRRCPWLKALLLGISLLLVPLGSALYHQLLPPLNSLRVAALGWTHEDLLQSGSENPLAVYQVYVEPLVAEAAAKGAKLVVTPEVAFRLTTKEKEDILQRIKLLARQHHLMLAVGYYDLERQENYLIWVNERGVVGTYLKTHLIPFIETYHAGSGKLTVVSSAGVLLGGMICQDDNFTDLARAYGRQRVQLLAIPTNDWAQVKSYHLENSLFRALENRYALIRAASNGISAIVSPQGKILAYRDHFQRGPGLIVADVPLWRGGTVYSWVGDWFPVTCLLLYLVLLLKHRLKATRS